MDVTCLIDVIDPASGEIVLEPDDVVDTLSERGRRALDIVNQCPTAYWARDGRDVHDARIARIVRERHDVYVIVIGPSS